MTLLKITYPRVGSASEPSQKVRLSQVILRLGSDALFDSSGSYLSHAALDFWDSSLNPRKSRPPDFCFFLYFACCAAACKKAKSGAARVVDDFLRDRSLDQSGKLCDAWSYSRFGDARKQIELPRLRFSPSLRIPLFVHFRKLPFTRRCNLSRTAGLLTLTELFKFTRSSRAQLDATSTLRSYSSQKELLPSLSRGR